MEPTPLARSRVPAAAAHLARWADEFPNGNHKMPFVEFSEDDVSWSDARRACVLDEIRSVREHATDLNRWERDFLDSVEAQLVDHGFLTTNQMAVLEGLSDRLG